MSFPDDTHQFDPSLYNRTYYEIHHKTHRHWQMAVGRDIVTRLELTSILDLGCGIGSFLEGACQAGCQDVLGVDISLAAAKPFVAEVISPFLRQGDISTNINLLRTFDCGFSSEVAEHLVSSSIQGLIDNLAQYAERYIIFTGAAPSQQEDIGHINCRDKDNWASLIEDKGFQLQQDVMDRVLPTWKGMGAPDYFLCNLLIFKRADAV